MRTDNHSTVSQSILVLGAGELGLPVLRNLAPLAARADSSVTVLLRASAIESQSPDKQQVIAQLRNLGVAILAGDLVACSVSELAEMFAPFDTVISCAGFVVGRGTQLKLTQAALEAGVKRYFPWQFGVDYDLIGRGSPQDLFDEQLDVRDLLRAQDKTEWVIVSTGMFTSFLFEPVLGVVDLANDTVHALGSLETEVTVTTPEDIGALTASIVFAEPRIRNQVVYTAGDTVSYGQLANILEAVSGRAFQRMEWSVPFLQAQLASDPEDSIKKYRAVFAQGTGVAWDEAVTFNKQQAINVTDVERWARSNLR